MNNKTCGECKHFEVDEIAAKCEKRCVICGDDIPACEYFEMKEPTVFDRITASPEVLAEVLVYESPGYNKDWDKDVFYRSKVDKFWVYTTRAEAIAATIAWLKEVER